jgi:ABC-2 type transport system permease protein
MWERIGNVLKKEFIQLFRDKRMRIMLFLPPIVQLIVFGYAATTDVKQIRTAILDEDRTHMSREFIETFEASGYFEITHVLFSPREVDSLMDRGKVKAFIQLPKGFGSSIAVGEGTEVLIVVDGTDSSTASVVIGYASRIAKSYSEDVLVKNIETIRGKMNSGIPIRISGIELNERTWYNEELESRNFFIPGIIGLLLTIVGVMLTSMAIVKEREMGTMEQLIVTPIKPIELIIGKLLPFAIIGYVNVALITIVGVLWFDVPFRGNIPFLLVAVGFILAPILGVGLFISTISATQQEAMMSTFLFTFPAMLLSGFVFPIESMPAMVRVLTYLDPMRYMMNILRGIFLKGNGPWELFGDLLGLFILGVLVVGLSSFRFRKRIK